MKTLRYIILMLALFAGSISNAQGQKSMHFAIGLFTGAQSQMVTYAFVTMMDGNFIGVEIVRKDRFMYTALGHWPHNINPNRENYFEKFNVDSCFLLKNGSKVAGYYAKPLDELWKIRFNEHPYAYDLLGWSQGQYTPSQSQRAFLLREYGINNILTEYIYGDTLFKLLRNVQSPAWVVNYKTAAKDTISGP